MFCKELCGNNAEEICNMYLDINERCGRMLLPRLLDLVLSLVIAQG